MERGGASETKHDIVRQHQNSVTMTCFWVEVTLIIARPENFAVKVLRFLLGFLYTKLVNFGHF